MYLCQRPASPACQPALTVNMGVEWGNRNEKQSPGNEKKKTCFSMFCSGVALE